MTNIQHLVDRISKLERELESAQRSLKYEENRSSVLYTQLADETRVTSNSGNVLCVMCNKYFPPDDVCFISNPFAQEIHDDHSLHWQCSTCLDNSVMDI